MDSFRPLLDVEKREDMFDIRMLLLRIASLGAIYYGASEFMKEPENLDNLLSGSSEVWNDMFEWGQNKFLGIPDNSTVIQTKKSARQIYAEAFMEDESMFGGGQRIYDETDYSVDPNLKSEDEPVEPEHTEDLDAVADEVDPVDLLESLMGDDDEGDL